VRFSRDSWQLLATGPGIVVEPSEISSHLAGANSGIDRQTALVIVVDAAQSYCPQFVRHVDNGATVVGRDH
jgi:hypothetical protein